MRTLTLITVFCLVLSSVGASAQHNSWSAATPRLVISEKAVIDALAAEQPAMREKRDSVKNGALIGAVVGAAIFGGFVTFLCNALQEPSDPSCLGSSLMGIGIGAGAGALGGAGIDALMYRGGSAPPKVGLPINEGWPVSRNAKP
jgi:hypothetical protein